MGLFFSTVQIRSLYTLHHSNIFARSYITLVLVSPSQISISQFYLHFTRNFFTKFLSTIQIHTNWKNRKASHNTFTQKAGPKKLLKLNPHGSFIGEKSPPISSARLLYIWDQEKRLDGFRCSSDYCPNISITFSRLVC